MNSKVKKQTGITIFIPRSGLNIVILLDIAIFCFYIVRFLLDGTINSFKSFLIAFAIIVGNLVVFTLVIYAILLLIKFINKKLKSKTAEN